MLACLLACTTVEPVSAPWEPSPTAPVVPLADPASVQDAFDTLVSGVRGWSAAPVVAAYERTLVDADGDCPSLDVENETYIWSDDCSTSEGAEFSGESHAHEYTGLLEQDAIVTGWLMVCVSDVAYADGTFFSCHGASTHTRSEKADGSTRFESIALGAFAAVLPEVEDTWLASGVSLSLSLAATVDLDGGRLVTADGSVRGFGHPTLTDGHVGSLSVDDASCPVGSLSVRDTQGEWYSATFDCDPCADVYFRDASLGEVCVDFAPLLDWSETPW